MLVPRKCLISGRLRSVRRLDYELHVHLQCNISLPRSKTPHLNLNWSTVALVSRKHRMQKDFMLLAELHHAHARATVHVRYVESRHHRSFRFWQSCCHLMPHGKLGSVVSLSSFKVCTIYPTTEILSKPNFSTVCSMLLSPASKLSHARLCH